jgi:N utilization substance protein B
VNASRSQARDAALQILYFWEVGGTAPEAAIDAFFREHQPDASGEVIAFARSIVGGTAAEVSAIDPLIEQHSRHWRLERLAIIDRLILRMAVWELRHPDDTPPAVIINEALELARRFSTEDAVRFVNGVLDAIHRADQAGPPAADPAADPERQA